MWLDKGSEQLNLPKVHLYPQGFKFNSFQSMHQVLLDFWEMTHKHTWIFFFSSCAHCKVQTQSSEDEVEELRVQRFPFFPRWTSELKSLYWLLLLHMIFLYFYLKPLLWYLVLSPSFCTDLACFLFPCKMSSFFFFKFFFFWSSSLHSFLLSLVDFSSVVIYSHSRGFATLVMLF